MKIRSLFALAFAVFTTAAVSGAASDRMVVLVSVDGLAHYYLDDPKAEMPNIRHLVAEGARAEKMKAVMPSVTWPNHTSIVTGVSPAKHGVVGNTWLDRATNEVVPLIWDSVFDKEQIVKSPTIYDVVKHAGLTTASVTWPGSRAAKTLDWTVPCVDKSDLFVKYSTPALLEEFKKAGIPYEDEAKGFEKNQGENRDRLHVEMLNHILRTHRPNLTLMHILEVDHIEHAFGPQTPEAYAAVKFADGLVGEIWREMQAVAPSKGTLIIVSDHGFFSYRQFIRPNVILKQAGLLTAIGSKITGGKARAVSQGGCSMIYVTDKAEREATMEKVRTAFKDVEGVALTLMPADFAKYGFADPAAQPQMADIVLSAKEGYVFNDVAAEDDPVSKPMDKIKGTHGYDPNEPRLHATFVACGAGIQAGTRAETITNTSVAPTIAKLLGLQMEAVEGRVLEEILAK